MFTEWKSSLLQTAPVRLEPSVSDLAACQIFMQYGTVVLHKKLSSTACSVKVAQLQSHFTYGRKWNYTRAFHTSRPLWVKFGAGDFHVTLLRNCKFVKNRRNESNTSLNGASDVMRVLNTLRQIWIHFSKGYVRKNILRNCEFLKKWRSDCRTVLCGTNNVCSFHKYCSIWKGFGIRGLFITENLTWQAQFYSLCANLNKTYYMIKSLKNVTNTQMIWSTYFANFQSRLRYGIMFWGGDKK